MSRKMNSLHPSIVGLVDFKNGHGFIITSGANQGTYTIECDADMEWLMNESQERWEQTFEEQEQKTINYRCNRFEQEFEGIFNFNPTW